MTSQRKGFQPHCDSDTKIMNTNTIKIANVANHVNRAEVVALFGTLIGDVRNTSEFRDAIGTHIEITFNTHDAAKKALCMSGYTIGGSSLVVTPVFKDDISPKLPDSRRNLYVLGIPFDLTKSEFAAIFSRFGKVAHSVILATVDNASRRRGFVVMASHEDAKCAMRGLTHTQIKGHTIDVSWSIVQRSEGFLDGGDRATVFDSYSNSGPEITQENEAVFPSVDSSETVASSPQEKSFSLTFTPTNHLLVTNLPFILFANTSDLEPLLFPFGPIKKLEMIALVSPQETSSAIVEYDALESATDAKESLQGQCYAQYRINAEYIVLPDASPNPPVPAFSEFDDFEIKFDRTLARNSFFSNSAPPSRSQSRNHSNAFQHKRPLQDISNSSNYLQHFAPPSALYAPKSGPLPQSNSSNSRWNNDPTQCYSSRIQYPYPSQMQTNGYKAQDRVVYTPVHN